MDDDDDEEEKQPEKYSFSAESKLDEDHLFYLQFTNNFISNVTRPRDFDHCTKWLERLAGEPMYGIEAKRNRNMYLAQLLIAMQDNKVKGPFSTFPPPGPLPNAAIAFGLSNPEEEETAEMLFDEIDRELNLADFKYESQDGRTYIATCALPNNGGVMAYVGLTFGGGEGLWLNKEGYNVKPDYSEEKVPSIDANTSPKKYVQMVEEYDELVHLGLDHPKLDAETLSFKYVKSLPDKHSDTNLIEVGNYKLSLQNREFMLELYPQDIVDIVDVLLEKSKKAIEERLKGRYSKLVDNLYLDYSTDVERGLLEYKKARQEWQTVYTVLAEIKEVLAEVEAKENQAALKAGAQGATDKPVGVLINSVNDAKRKHKSQMETGDELDSKKVELHKDIHERALYHMHEVQNLDSHIEKLTIEICNLRKDTRKKQQLIQSLTMQVQAGKEALLAARRENLDM